MTVLWLVLAAALGGVAGWLARGGGVRRATPDAPGAADPSPYPTLVRRMAEDLEVGRRPTVDGGSAPVELVALQRALAERWAPRDEERDRALRDALGRVHAFLQARVREPLLLGVEGDGDTLRQAAAHALGAVGDLEFFLREPLTAAELTDVEARTRQVAKEYANDWDVEVRVDAPDGPARAHVHPAALMDALYLLLHNAGTFGGGRPVDVGVTRDGSRVRVDVRDRGPGFSEEALARAHELFYSTAPAGLGLGIPFARRVVEGFGGEIELRNLEGGAAVTLWLPGA